MLALYLSAIEDHAYDDKFEKIYYTYRNYMYNIAYSILGKSDLSEDAVQDAMFIIAKMISKIYDDNAQILKSFVYILTKNCALKIYRNEQKNRVISIDDIEFLADTIDLTEDIASKENYNNIVRYILTLPTKHSDILMLHLVYSLKNEEISKIIGLPVATVKTRIWRMKKKLREVIKEMRTNE